jgi:hypothetical protein
MNPEDDGVALAAGGGVEIERLPLVFRFGVGDVALEIGLGSGGDGGPTEEG